MKIFSVVDQGFFAGSRLADKLEVDLIDSFPSSECKIDANHCPRWENGVWIDDDSDLAKEMSAKYHAPPKFTLPPMPKRFK